MKPRAKSVLSTKVSKAVKLPSHPLKPRLEKVLEAVDKIHVLNSLKAAPVILDRRVPGGLFCAYGDTGPYNIYLNPRGSHPELSLLHEIGHYLEWQTIPKTQAGLRDFSTDPRFADWLNAVYNTAMVRHHLQLLEQQEEGSQAFNDIGYLLRPNELWTRAYSQHIAHAASLPVLFQQIAAENKVVTGNIKYTPYWDWVEFALIQKTMYVIFAGLGWSK